MKTILLAALLTDSLAPCVKVLSGVPPLLPSDGNHSLLERNAQEVIRSPPCYSRPDPSTEEGMGKGYFEIYVLALLIC